jgi:tRNA dimethylallyltransferase
LISEVDSLVAKGIRDGVTARRALGYAQILSMRDGVMSESEAKEDTKRATRQYARRQETWFSRDARIKWIAPHQNRLEIVREKLNSNPS